MTTLEVTATYGSIEAARDICEPWIEMEGTEWGESMRGLHSASHTSYGFSDEDCALFATKLIENLILAQEFFFEYYEKDEIEHAQKASNESRDYWLKGGNLGDWGNTKEDAKVAINLFPEWVFGD
jgi:hypothetical protein